MQWLKQIFRAILFYFFLVTLFGGGGFLIYFLSKKGYPTWFLWVFFIYFLQVTFSISIFVQHRQNYAKLSWLIVTIIFPIFGHVIFLLFGLRYFDYKSLKKYHQKNNFKYEKKLLKNSQQFDDIFFAQSNISQRGIYRGNFKIFKNVGRGFEQMFRDFEKATKFIHIEYYIIKPGEIYDHFKTILIKKAKTGVKIRMIIDDFGQWGMPWYEITDLKKHGIEIRILGKVYFPFIGSRNGYRNHRKLVIIDGKIAYTGGANIADEYASLKKKYGLWIDYKVKMTGQIVRSYSLLFLEDWNYVGQKITNFKEYLLESKTGNSAGILVEDTPELQDNILESSIIKWILSAKKTIKITTPYLIPTPNIFEALKIAALSGVEVKIFIPGWPDKKIVYFSTNYWASELAKYGVKIYKTNKMLIHSKIGIFDDKYAYFGTFNWDFRSMYSQFELATLVKGRVVNDLKDLFIYYESLSKQINLKELQTNLISQKILRGFLMFFAPIM